MKKTFFSFALAATALFLSVTGCMKPSNGDDNGYHTDPPMTASLIIANEGSFNNGDASLSRYDLATGTLTNNIFSKANKNAKLGDIAHSLNRHKDLLWIVVNNSHVVFATDPYSFKEKGRITGLTSPRYIHFISDEKAYITQMYSNRIAIVNPKTYKITGHIETSAKDGTEQMVQVGKYVYTNCWNYSKKVLKIDSETDTVVEEVETGIQPSSIALDKNNKIWVLTDGGYPGCPIGEEQPALNILDPKTMKVEKKLAFAKGSFVSSLCINGTKDTLYFINGDVYKMGIEDKTLPKALINSSGETFYDMSVNPISPIIAVSDAIDFKQNGKVYIYDMDGKKLEELSVGICPGAFCWY